MNELEAAIKRATYGRTFPKTANTPSNLALKDDPPPERPKYPKIIDIKREVADYYSMEVHDLDSAHRDKRITYVRHIAIYLCRRMTLHSYPEIGRRMGGRDHTTIMHAYDKVSARINTVDGQAMKNEIEELKSIIGGTINGQEK